jgi:5-formyltetrahydrofolate cyclo-ligase
MSSDKDAIRRQMRRRRRGLPRREHQHRSRSLVRILAGSSLFHRSHHIALYLPNDGEVDLRPLAERIWANGKRCYLPVLSPAFHNRLWFTPYTPETPLVKNCFGIPEPQRRWRHTRPAWALDLILAPLVAFDATGNRLGMGGGFYDRTLAFLDQRQYLRKPRLFGVAFDFQRSDDALPSESWDVPMEGVITDRGFMGTQ